MHRFFHNPKDVPPAFLIKLWNLVEDTATDGLITWNATGSSFIISNADRFAREILPLHFKHNNLHSFIRQLNTYGFKKVINYGKASNSQELEFQNAFFSKDKIELLTNIKRRIRASKNVTESETETNVNSKDFLVSLSTLREKQRAMDTTLNQMKKENEILWRELSTVRQRHKAQEQVLHKVIQFLVQIIQRSNQNIHVPRKLARMLQNISVSQENSSHIARIVDALKSKDSDFIKNQDEVPKNSHGAVIHEVTDVEPETFNFLNSQHNKKVDNSIFKTSNDKKTSINSKQNSTLTPPEFINVTKDISSRDIELRTTDITKKFPTKFVAVPLAEDANKLFLVPLENFTDEEISSLSKDSLCNVIALPQDESLNLSNAEQMDCAPENSLSNQSNISNTEENCCSVNKFSEPLCTTLSSDVMPCDLISRQNLDDSILVDLLKASKISSPNPSSDQTVKSDYNNITDTLLSSEDEGTTHSTMDSYNNQVAIPGPSSLVKSSKNLFPDFSILQDPLNPSTIDMKLFEQLLNGDESVNAESLINSSLIDVDINSPSESIVGNELVQFTPSVSEENTGTDQLQWLDFLSNETCSAESESFDNLFCGPKDFDVLLPSKDNVFPSSLEVLKKETLLTASPNPQQKESQKNKRQKCT